MFIFMQKIMYDSNLLFYKLIILGTLGMPDHN